MGEDSCVHPMIEESFILFFFLMTFPLDFDLLVIGVCTFIQGKKKKNKDKNKNKKKQKKNKNKKKVRRYVCVSYLTPSIFCCWVHQWGFE